MSDKILFNMLTEAKNPNVRKMLLNKYIENNFLDLCELSTKKNTEKEQTELQNDIATAITAFIFLNPDQLSDYNNNIDSIISKLKYFTDITSITPSKNPSILKLLFILLVEAIQDIDTPAKITENIGIYLSKLYNWSINAYNNGTLDQESQNIQNNIKAMFNEYGNSLTLLTTVYNDMPQSIDQDDIIAKLNSQEQTKAQAQLKTKILNSLIENEKLPYMAKVIDIIKDYKNNNSHKLKPDNNGYIYVEHASHGLPISFRFKEENGKFNIIISPKKKNILSAIIPHSKTSFNKNKTNKFEGGFKKADMNLNATLTPNNNYKNEFELDFSNQISIILSNKVKSSDDRNQLETNDKISKILYDANKDIFVQSQIIGAGKKENGINIMSSYANNGSLLDHVCKLAVKIDGAKNETTLNTAIADLKDAMQQVYDIASFFYSNGLVHNDLKFENFVIDINKATGKATVKVIDCDNIIISHRSPSEQIITRYYSLVYQTKDSELKHILNKGNRSYNDIFSVSMMYKKILESISSDDIKNIHFAKENAMILKDLDMCYDKQNYFKDKINTNTDFFKRSHLMKDEARENLMNQFIKRDIQLYKNDPQYNLIIQQLHQTSQNMFCNARKERNKI